MDTSDTPRQEVSASTLPQIQVTVRGITNQYGAECLGQQMFHILREVGEYIDISALDGVTVAVDYDEALRDLDRGVEGLAPLSRTNDEGLAGVGKSIVVMRGDAVKTHIVLSAGFAVNEEARFRDNLAVRLKDCRSRARDAIGSYRLHGNVVRVFEEVGIVILEPLRIASYLFGHLDGMNKYDTLCEVVPELPTEDQAFVRVIGRLVEQLRGLWDTRGAGEL